MKLTRVLATVLAGALVALTPATLLADTASAPAAPATEAKAESVEGKVTVKKEGDKVTVSIELEDKTVLTAVDGKAKVADLAKLDGKEVEVTGVVDKTAKTVAVDAFEEVTEEGGEE